MIDFNKVKNGYKHLIEDSLPSFLPIEQLDQGDVVEAMKYSLCSSGKRIRGTLTLAFYTLFGGENLNEAIPFAVSTEMVHTYSLIHDDLPCMDNDDLRRGKASCHIKFGEATALLAGDGLLTLAFEILSNPLNLSNFSSENIVKVIYTLAKAIGINGMIGGQVLDLANEKKMATIEEVIDTELKKTGALITASALLGAIIAGATNKEQELIKVFGDNLGLAFQIIDDILDATSTPEVLGKPIGSDKENNKTTFTSIYGIDKAREQALLHTNQSIDALKRLKKDTLFLEYFTKQLLSRNY